MNDAAGSAANSDAENSMKENGDDEDIVSAPARRHMEERLDQMEKERSKLDAEIAHLRQKLYGSVDAAHS